MLFNDVLFFATLATGIIWILDRLWLRRHRPSGRRSNWALEICVSLFPVIFLVFLVRSFVIEPFRIPSGSMIPTLDVGDFILVNRFSYGLRCPIGHCVLVDTGKPKVGDVAVFAYPGTSPGDPDRGEDFIKRVVGVPGDHIRYGDKVLYINGKRAKVQPDGIYPLRGVDYKEEIETLDGVRHKILVNPNLPARDFSYTVPPGQYFVMGDNRDNSYDSRYWGTVPFKDFVGRAFFIWFSWDARKFRPDFSRFGLVIH